MTDRRRDPPPTRADARSRVRRRFRLVAAAVLVGWVVAVAVITAAATGTWGDLGVPADESPGARPRGLLVIGAGTLVAGAVLAVAYRRMSGPMGELVGAAEQVARGDYRVDVEVRGFRELRVLTESFNEMAARLADNEQQRRRFLADITHELRNPLAVLQSEIEAQLDGVHPRDDDRMASLLEETRRLGHLVDDLHTLALAETGRLVLQQEAVALADLVDDVLARHEAQAGRHGVALRASIAPELPKAWIDPARVRQALDNLLANAIRHTPAGGAVLVEVTRLEGTRSGEDPMVQCRVTDAGPGFRDDQLGHVFERFERPGDSRGSGLGLSIARDLVAAHGGTIDAGNDPTTGGASVRFTLPT